MSQALNTIKLEWLNPKDSDQVAKLRTFAASFDHSIDSLAHPIFIVKRGDEWIGYAQTVHVPTIFTAWKPGAAKPKDILFAMMHFLGWVKLQFGGGFTTVSTDPKCKFIPSIMEKLGLRRMNLELYEPEK